MGMLLSDYFSTIYQPDLEGQKKNSFKFALIWVVYLVSPMEGMLALYLHDFCCTSPAFFAGGWGWVCIFVCVCVCVAQAVICRSFVWMVGAECSAEAEALVERSRSHGLSGCGVHEKELVRGHKRSAITHRAPTNADQ